MLYLRKFRLVSSVPYLFVLYLCLGVSSLLAQFTSNIQGTIQDQSGAVLPKVTVKLKNTSTAVEVTTASGESGAYRFSSLAPGTYEVTAEAPGFQAAKSTISVFTGQTAAANLTLAVAGASTEVSVTSETPAIATDDSRTQMTVRTQQLQDLPVQGQKLPESGCCGARCYWTRLCGGRRTG